MAEIDEENDAEYGPRVSGRHYIDFLRNIHETLKPRTYFEVGTQSGASLSVSSCSSIAVDPQFKISTDVIGSKPSCMLFQETSDAFFRKNDPTALFGEYIDLSFLDGMHLFEFLLRDFINTERYCRSNSLIVLHDCLPPGFYMTIRDLSDPLFAKSRYGNWWTGDVWKIIPVLKKYRPDISITVTDCAPTGLVLISNLDNKSDTLRDNYGNITKEYSRDVIDRTEYELFWNDVEITPSETLETFSQLSTKFWL